jgi:hypothetical protein
MMVLIFFDVILKNYSAAGVSTAESTATAI